jgi:hypothetical protein
MPLRSLVAEDRSAEGVHDQTGPQMLTRLLTGREVVPVSVEVEVAVPA